MCVLMAVKILPEHLAKVKRQSEKIAESGKQTERSTAKYTLCCFMPPAPL